MKLKMLMGVTAAGVLVGVGVLAGSVVGSSQVSAQTPTTSPTVAPAQPGNIPAPPNGQPDMPDMHGWVGRDGMHGKGGGFGPGGPGMHGGLDGGPGGAATADVASREITETTTFITLVKGDLAYANGKMDTTDVQRWITGADSLLKSAQSANSSAQYGQAAGYAHAARQLAEIADSQMALKLGADKLPSYSQRPQRPNRPGDANGNVNGPATLTQALASRILQNSYNQLLMHGALIKSAAKGSDATTYLTEAQNAYKTAYDAYQAGKYTDAVTAAELSGRLAGVAESILRATTAPNDSTTPVTVPAPTF